MFTLLSAEIVLPIAGEPVRDGAVLVEFDRIAAVGPLDRLMAEHPGIGVHRLPGVLVPGLVNAHAHLQYTDFADLAGLGLPFAEWISLLIGRRASFTDDMWRESTRRGIRGLLGSGTTAVADVVTDPCVLAPTAEARLEGVSYLEVVGTDDARWAGGGRAALIDTLAAVPAGRRVGLSPHTLYTVTPDVVRDICALARERGLRLHPHLAETADEDEFVRHGKGRLADLADAVGLDHPVVRDGGRAISPVALLDTLGGLGPDVHAAHCVHCAAVDRALLAGRGTAVALCVRSNRILGAGEPPIAAYLAERRPIALGTDSLASSPSLDLWAEAAAARDLARAQGYGPTDLDRRLVEAVTVGGASALGLEDTGVLVPGARADLAVFDVPTDGGDPYAALVDHGAGRCRMTVLGGRVVHGG